MDNMVYCGENIPKQYYSAPMEEISMTIQGDSSTDLQ